MGCCHHYLPVEGGEASFTAEMPALTFGPGSLDEVGARAAARGLKRAALFTDARLAALEPVSRARRSLAAAGLDAAVYDAARIEPDIDGVEQAAAFLADGGFDGAVSVGGGSVMDTCKAALILAGDGAKFQNANLSASTLSGSSFKEANFVRANLTRTSFREADLEGANLTKAFGQRTSFKGAKMVVRGTSWRGTKTKDTYSLKGFTAAYKKINEICGS